MNPIRRSVAAAVTCIGLAVLAAAPAGAQTQRAQPSNQDVRYLQAPTQTQGAMFANTGGGAPGAVLGNSGVRTTPAAASSGGGAPGAVSGNSGVRATPGSPAVSGAVLPLQVSSGAVAGAAQPRAQVQGLAFTGADVAGLVMFGLVAIGIGAALTRRARPRSTPQG